MADDKILRLGFVPRMEFPAAGVTFGSRQNALRKVAAIYDRGTQITNTKGGMFLRPEPENKYDPYAIGIHCATELLDGELGEVLHVGYVPQRWCPKCGSFLQVRERAKDMCQNCGRSLADDPVSHLGKWITEMFVRTQKGLYTGITWCGTSESGKSYGLRVAIAWLE